MRQFVFAAALFGALGALDTTPATAQGCASGMCALPGAATGQQQQQQAAPGTGMMGGMCHCCRMMAMAQPQPGMQGGGMGMQGGGGGMGGMGGMDF